MKTVQPGAGRSSAFPFLGYGVGLRTAHLGELFSDASTVDFVEIISDDFLESAGRTRRVLDRASERYPIVMHGVSLSIGGTAPLDRRYLRMLRDLSRRSRAAIVSDHVCWTGVPPLDTHDLLPLPYTEESLKHVVRRIRQAQDAMERPLVLENPSSYAHFTFSSLTEWEFLGRMAEESGCGLLLDVNNVFVTAANNQFDPRTYIREIPAERVAYYHLAGHRRMAGCLIDSHSRPVSDRVWDLYRFAVRTLGPRSTVVEWDADLPTFDRLQEESRRARDQAEAALEETHGSPVR